MHTNKQSEDAEYSGSNVPSMLKCFVKNLATGTSLTRLSLPASVCRPQSTLQALALRRLRGAPYLQGVWQHEDPFLRMVAVLRWYLAAFPAEESKKPFNPVLGETYQCTADGVWSVLEQVSHHPPVTAYFLLDSTRRACFFGQAEMSPQFSGNAVTVDMIGPSRLVLGMKKQIPHKGDEDLSQAREDAGRAKGTSDEAGEAEEEEETGEGTWWHKYEYYEFSPQMPTQVMKGVLWGKRRIIYKGRVTVSCSRTSFFANLHFCEEGPRGEPDFVEGEIYHEPHHRLMARIHGQWNGIVEIHPVPEALKGLSDAPLQAGVLCRVSHTTEPQVSEIVDSRQQGRDSRHAMVSVWRTVCEALRQGDFDAADVAKQQVEQQQREMIHTQHRASPPTTTTSALTKKEKAKRALNKLTKKGKEFVSDDADTSGGNDEDNPDESSWRLRHPPIFFQGRPSSDHHNIEWHIRWNQIKFLPVRNDRDTTGSAQ